MSLGKYQYLLPLLQEYMTLFFYFAQFIITLSNLKKTSKIDENYYPDSESFLAKVD